LDHLEKFACFRVFLAVGEHEDAEGLLDALTGSNLEAAPNIAMPKPSSEDYRTVAQKRRDAINDIALEIVGNKNPSDTSGERTHVTVYVDAASGLARLDQRICLASTTRDMLLCDCITTSVWLKTNGNPFDVGTPESEIPPPKPSSSQGPRSWMPVPGMWSIITVD
jgi:Domain of unknown function (DUF222)